MTLSLLWIILSICMQCNVHGMSLWEADLHDILSNWRILRIKKLCLLFYSPAGVDSALFSNLAMWLTAFLLVLMFSLVMFTNSIQRDRLSAGSHQHRQRQYQEGVYQVFQDSKQHRVELMPRCLTQGLVNKNRTFICKKNSSWEFLNIINVR